MLDNGGHYGYIDCPDANAGLNRHLNDLRERTDELTCMVEMKYTFSIPVSERNGFGSAQPAFQKSSIFVATYEQQTSIIF